MSKRSILLFVALALGLGWAIRGHFGHEHGAAWAGALGVTALIIISKRHDWLKRLPAIAAIGGIGWGVGGMMSYGRIIGYSRGTELGDVVDGLAMLGIVGGLYGFIGGGFTGLVLESKQDKKPDWARLIVEMAVGGFLAWGWFIYQLEWFMTPPRSELWAACLGGSIALLWFAYRNRYFNAIRVAAYSALGAGFGFAFGEFIQILGRVSGIGFNWWNAMEFTLGFSGGLGMAYGVFTRDWDESIEPSRAANWLGIATLLLIIPATNIIQAFEKEGFLEVANQIGTLNPGQFASNQILYGWVTLILFVLLGVYLWRRFQQVDYLSRVQTAASLFFVLTGFYVVLGNLRKSLFQISGQLEQYLYWVIFLILLLIWFFSRNNESPELKFSGPAESGKRWVILFVGLIGIIALLTLVAINIHDGLPGSHTRF